MKRLAVFLFSFVFLSNLIFGFHSGNISPKTVKTPCFFPPDNSYGFSQYTNRVGDQNGYLFRNICQFDPVSIPQGAFDVKVTLLIVGAQEIGSSFNVIQLANNYQIPTVAKDAYNGITGNIIASVSAPGNNEVEITSQALSGGTLTFGAVATNNMGLTYPSFYIKVQYSQPVTIKNDFEYGIISCGIGSTPVETSSPAKLNAKVGQTVNIKAIEQSYADIQRKWLSSSKWTKKIGNGEPSYLTSDIAYSFIVTESDSNTSYIANYTKIYTISCENRSSTQSIGGTVSYKGSLVPVTQKFYASEDSTISLTAVNQNVINGMSYTFSHWDDNSTNPTISWVPSNNTNRIAYFVGKPIYTTTDRNLRVTNTLRTNPRLTWNEHSNPLVTSYKIYRKVLKGPNADPGSLIATVSRGTLSYTDWDYYNIGTSDQDMIFYDVDAYCQSENTSSDQYWAGIYYGILIKGTDSLKISSINQMDLDNC